MRAVRAERAALFLRSKRCPCASFALLQGAHSDRRKRHGLPQSAPEFPKRAIRFSPPGIGLKRRIPAKSAPRCRKAGCSTRPFRQAGRRAKIVRRSACAPRLSIHCFLRSKRCPCASFALFQGAHSDRRKRHGLPQSAPEFPKRAIRFSSPGIGLKRRSPQRALPPLKGRLLHAAFSPYRTACENRPPISLCAAALPGIAFCAQSAAPARHSRCFKARIPTGESGMACRKARPNFRSAPFVSHPRHWP